LASGHHAARAIGFGVPGDSIAVAGIDPEIAIAATTAHTHRK